MKRQDLPKVFLVLLPLMAVVLATTGDSVTVYDTAAGTVAYSSYFTPVEVGGLTMLPVLAGVLAAVCLVLAILAATGRGWAYKGILVTAFCAALCATAPIWMQGDILVVPNAMFPLFMMTTVAISAYAGKKPRQKKTGPRLA